MMQAAFHDHSHTRIHSALEYLTPSGFAERRQQNAENARSCGKQITECKACIK